MCPLLAESSNVDEDDDLAPDRAAAEVIDTMALDLSKHVFPLVFDFASLSCQDANPKFREASATALSVVSEGCAELVKEKSYYVLPAHFLTSSYCHSPCNHATTSVLQPSTFSLHTPTACALPGHVLPVGSRSFTRHLWLFIAKEKKG